MVVTEGLTILEVCPKTEPMPLSIERVVGLPVTVKDKVELWPAVIDTGEAVKEEIVGGKTVTVTAAVTVPPPLVAVKV